MQVKKGLNRSWKAWGHWNNVKEILALLGFWPIPFTPGGAGLTFVWAAIDGWSPAAVWIGSLGAGAFCSVIWAAITVGINSRKSVPDVGTVEEASPARNERGAHSPIPITPQSIFSFLNGYPIVREMDSAISQSLGLDMYDEPCPAHVLSNAANHLRISSLTELEGLMREHQETVIGLARYLRLRGDGRKPATIARGYSVHMLLQMLAARSGSVDRYNDYAKAFGAVGSVGQDVIDAYKELTASRLSRPNVRFEVEYAPQLEGAPLAWATVPFLHWLPRGDGGRDIISIAIDGKNVGDKEVKLENAFIVSGFTGARFEMKVTAANGRNVQMVPLRKTRPIPPEAEINLLSVELNGQEGIEESQFQKYWGSVGFVVEFDGQEHRRTYDPEAINEALELGRFDPPKPHVTLRDDDDKNS